MKVGSINGSPNKKGNTHHALTLIGAKLQENGIDFEIIHMDNKAIRGCTACGLCRKNQDEKCSIVINVVNEVVPQMKQHGLAA